MLRAIQLRSRPQVALSAQQRRHWAAAAAQRRRAPPREPVAVAASATAARFRRLAQIARFSAAAYAKTRLLARGALAAADVGAWLAAESSRMGPLFVKLAQLISARGDAVDPRLAAALAVVQDEVECEAAAPVVPGFAVEAARGPLKSGSIASVWLATRERDGAVVVVKQLRAGVRESFDLDLPALLSVLRSAAALGVPGAANFYEIVSESQAMLRAETDMRREAASMRAFRARAPEGVVVPRVVRSGPDYIVQEYVPAPKIARVRPPCAPLARRLMLAFARSVMDTGLVHADPHPGNIGVLPGGKLVFYDFGACVDVSPVRASIARLFRAGAAGNLDALVEAMIDVGIVEARGSDAYRLVKLLEDLARVNPDDFHVALSEQPEFSDSAGRRLVRFNTEVVYMLRALSLVEGTCRRLDPNFSYRRYWERDLQDVAISALDDGDAEDEDAVAAVLGRWARSAVAMPDTSRRTLDATHQLNVELRDELRGLRGAMARADAAALALGLLLALAIRAWS